MWAWVTLGANAVTLVAAAYILRQQTTIRRQLDSIHRAARLTHDRVATGPLKCTHERGCD